MADLSTIQKAFETKQAFDTGTPYKGATRVGFEGDQASIGGEKFSSPEALYQAITGRGGSTTSGGSSSSETSYNFEDSIKRALEMQQEAVKPAIESLRAGIPEIKDRFAQTASQVQAEIDPLKQRYESLLNEVRQRGTQQEQAQTKVTSQELGKRGLVGSSTLAQQEIQNAVQPIQQATTGAIQETTLAREEGIRNLQNILANLPQQETESIRAVQNAIAQLQSGASQAGISQGVQTGQFNAQQQLDQQQAEFAKQQAERQAQQQAIENALAQRSFEEVTLPMTQYQLNAPYYKPETGGGLTAQDFLSMFGGGMTQPQTTGFSNVDSLLAQGKYNEARQLLLNP